MKIQTTSSPFILFLLPTLAGALAPHAVEPAAHHAPALAVAAPIIPESAEVPVPARRGVPTKDAPVDGKDGKPHLGPFVETDGVTTGLDGGEIDPPYLKGRPNDPTVVDGKRIPKSNDGVMFDKNREHAQEGTTGTEGGVSEKAKARKAQENQTGEKTVTQPGVPKEHPPLPHSEEEKIRETTRKATKGKGADSSFTGLEKPNGLPDKIQDTQLPIPDSANKNHLNTGTGSSSTLPVDAETGIVASFHSFALSFTMILVSEIGDKTFLVAALMAMKHDRMVVFTAAFGALVVMTALSALLGQVVPSLIPKRLTAFLAAVLFFVFGSKLLKEGMEMDPNEGVSAEMHEVEQELAEKEKEMGRKKGESISPYALEMGLNGRRSRSNGRFPSPPRSPSQSPVRGSSGASAITSIVSGASNLCALLLSPAWVQTFVMTFLGEWGDRSQIATIAMAAGDDYWGVTLGAICGHAICTSVAVIGGRAIAGRVSLKVVTVGGALAFLVFGVIYLIESFYS